MTDVCEICCGELTPAVGKIQPVINEECFICQVNVHKLYLGEKKLFWLGNNMKTYCRLF